MRCVMCEGTGKFKQPSNENVYNDTFDKYDAMGTFTMGECREKALEKSGFHLIHCPKCNGTGNCE